VIATTPDLAAVVDHQVLTDRLQAGHGFEIAALWEPGGIVQALGALRVIESIEAMPGRNDRLVVHLSGPVEIVCSPRAARRYASPGTLNAILAEDATEAVPAS